MLVAQHGVWAVGMSAGRVGWVGRQLLGPPARLNRTPQQQPPPAPHLLVIALVHRQPRVAALQDGQQQLVVDLGIRGEQEDL